MEIRDSKKKVSVQSSDTLQIEGPVTGASYSSIVHRDQQHGTKYPRRPAGRVIARCALHLSPAFLLLVTSSVFSHAQVDATASPQVAATKSQSDAAEVDATIKIIDYDKIEVTFNFHDAKNRAEYTVVKVGAKQESLPDDSNPPFLLGKLSKTAITSSSQANHILVGVSGTGNPSAAINISNLQASGDKTGKQTFRIGFLRFSELKKNAADNIAVSLPGITYGQVNVVTVLKPSWSSEIDFKYGDRTSVISDFDGASTFHLDDDVGMASIDVVPEDSAIKRYSRIVLDNVIFFTGTVVIGAIFAFLAPAPSHKIVRALLGIMAAVLGIWLMREAWFSSPPGRSIENYASVLSAEIGLLISIAFFERLDRLVQLFGK